MTKWFVSRAAFIISAPRALSACAIRAAKKSRSFLPRFQKPPKGVRTRNLAVQGIGSAKRRARTRPFSYSGAVLPRRASRGFRRAGPASIPASPSGFPRLVPSRERRDVQRLRSRSRICASQIRRWRAAVLGNGAACFRRMPTAFGGRGAGWARTATRSLPGSRAGMRNRGSRSPARLALAPFAPSEQVEDRTGS
jgi:hypothetical protein